MHCLENFSAVVRQNARGDERSVAAYRIMAQTICALLEIQNSHISISYHGRDNVGGVVIADEPVELTEDLIHRNFRICQSFLAMVGLDFSKTTPDFTAEELKDFLKTWSDPDDHHKKDQTYDTHDGNSLANRKITLRYSHMNQPPL
jgi:hypothetical protein